MTEGNKERKPVVKIDINASSKVPVGFVEIITKPDGKQTALYNYKETFIPKFHDYMYVGESVHGAMYIYNLIDSHGNEVVMFLPTDYNDKKKLHKKFDKVFPLDDAVPIESYRITFQKVPPKKGTIPAWGNVKVEIVDESKADEMYEEEDSLFDDDDDVKTDKEIWEEIIGEVMQKKPNTKLATILKTVTSDEAAKRVGKRYDKPDMKPLTEDEAKEIYDKIQV